jgi:hypothetical protein
MKEKKDEEPWWAWYLYVFAAFLGFYIALATH